MPRWFRGFFMARLTKSDKEKIVENLKDKIGSSNAIVITDYHGISVPQMQELKNSLKEVGADFTVSKNTLIAIAAKKAGKDIPEDSLCGPTAVLYSKQDPIEAVKKLADFIKKYKLPLVKTGILEGEVLTKDQVLLLADIPGRQELYAKVVGGLNAPIAGFVGVLNANLRNLVFAIDQIREQKTG